MTAPDDAAAPVAELTRQEAIALLTVAAGFTQVAAARQLRIGSRTLRRRITEAVARLDAVSQAHAVALAAASDQLDLTAVRNRRLPAWPKLKATPRLRPAEAAELRRKLGFLLSQGVEIGAAAKRLGINRSTAYRWRKQFEERDRRRGV